MKKSILILSIVILFQPALVAHAQTPSWLTPSQTANTSVQDQSTTNSQQALQQISNSAQKSLCAQGGAICYTPLEPLTDYNAGENGYRSLADYLSTIFKILITFGALSAVVMLVWGGITYIVSDAVDMKSKAKKRIQASLLGLALLAGSYLILNTINPELLKFNLNVGNLSTTAQKDANTPAKPLEMVSSGTLSAAQLRDIGEAFRECPDTNQCGKPTVWDQYVLYDSKSEDDPKVKTEIEKFKTYCKDSGWLKETTGVAYFGYIKPITGTVFDAPGQTALVCTSY